MRIRVNNNIHNRKPKDQNYKKKKKLVETIEKVWGERITHVTQLYGCVNIIKFIPQQQMFIL